MFAGRWRMCAAPSTTSRHAASRARRNYWPCAMWSRPRRSCSAARSSSRRGCWWNARGVRGEPGGWSADAAARTRIERIAMHAVIAAERALGHAVIDVSAQKCGWDLTSQPQPVDGRLTTSRHIEVKGRAKGQSTITVTRNEILYGLNQAD